MLRLQVTSSPGALNNINSKLGEKAFDRAMHHVMIQARNMSKNHYCPVKTGMLRDSIYIRKVGEGVYEMGFTVYYGVWHEFGSYNIDPEGRGTIENPVIVKTGIIQIGVHLHKPNTGMYVKNVIIRDILYT